MNCHLCGLEAVGRCYTCGNLFCAKHGDVNCLRCETGIVEGDFRADRITASPREGAGQRPWWRPQVAEEFDPPACHICQALARRVCRNCQSLYCADHAGAADLCSSCTRSSRLGLFILAGVLVLMVGLMLLGDWSR